MPQYQDPTSAIDPPGLLSGILECRSRLSNLFSRDQVSIVAMHRRNVKSYLDAVQQGALREFRTRLLNELDFVESLTLFGSTVRGTAQDGSDIDLLVLTSRPLDNRSRHMITDIQFDINLKYGTNFSSLVVAASEWEHGVASVLPIKRAIVRDGIPV